MESESSLRIRMEAGRVVERRFKKLSALGAAALGAVVTFDAFVGLGVGDGMFTGLVAVENGLTLYLWHSAHQYRQQTEQEVNQRLNDNPQQGR